MKREIAEEGEKIKSLNCTEDNFGWNTTFKLTQIKILNNFMLPPYFLSKKINKFRFYKSSGNQ